jgi:hypothetical protein
MFYNCNNITSVSNINALVNLTNGYTMFYNCNNLTGSINLAGLSNLAIGYRMFYNCTNLTGSINLSGLSKLTNGYSMFYYCNNITSIIETSFDSLTLTTLPNSGLSYTFYYCNNMTGNALRLLSASRNVYLDPGTRLNTFSICAKLTDYSLIHTNWK